MTTGVCRMQTRYEVECWRAGSLVWAEHYFNLVMTSGLNKVLDATFKTGLTSPAWYIGLISASGFTGYAGSDTMAAHSGWSEFTSYSVGTRQAFTPGTIAAGSVNNGLSRATFNITAPGTVQGSFLADDNTKSGTSGTLYGAGSFSSAQTVIGGDQVRVSITVSAQ